MTLVNRVSAFFLVALAIALVGCSIAFYAIIRSHLYGQFEQDLQTSLQILAAAIEVEEDDVKWDPAERSLEFDDEQVLGRVNWVITNERNQVIDHSPALRRSDPRDAPVFDVAEAGFENRNGAKAVGDWRFLQKELAAPRPKPFAEREPHEYSHLIVTVAKSLDPLHADMQRLALLVGGLPLAIFLVAAAAGRWYCRHALQPVTAMADRARSMSGADFYLRMPVESAGDELAELGQAFNQLLGQLQQAFEQQRRFTGDAAHQLRTPLTVLQGQIDVALRRPREPDVYRRTLDVMQTQVKELRQSVESLLYLARAADDALPRAAERLELDTWLPELAARWKSHPRGGDFRLEIDSEACISASPPLVTQLLDNLVDNAFKYSAAGSPVTLSVTQRSGRVLVSVEDRGLGIAADDLGAVFDPFYRSPFARQAGIAGTGLGLAVAARIAAALGGDITCDSQLGVGSRLTVSFEEVGSDAADKEAHISVQ